MREFAERCWEFVTSTTWDAAIGAAIIALLIGVGG